MKWQAKKISEVCEINPRRPSGFGRLDGAPTTFVSMPAVAENGAGIVVSEQRPYSIVRKGYTYFVEGDVLFAKITPCMQNGKHAVARGLIDGIGFGSTEFHVLRPHERVLAEWIHRFLIQPKVLHDAEVYFTGAVGQQRVPDSYLAELEIPLPPLDEQRRIVGKLDAQMKEVEKMRAAVEAKLAAARALPSSFLRTVFNSPESQPWPVKKLGEVCEMYSGRWGEDVEIPGSRQMRVLTVGNISSDGYIFANQATTRYFAERDVDAIAHEGDLLVVKSSGSATNIRSGKTGICSRELDGKIACSNFIMRLVPDRNNAEPKLLWHILNSDSAREFVQTIAGSSTYPNIKWKEFQKFSFSLPPIATQRRIVARLDEQMAHADALIRALESEREAIAALPAALLREVFG